MRTIRKKPQNYVTAATRVEVYDYLNIVEIVFATLSSVEKHENCISFPTRNNYVGKSCISFIALSFFTTLSSIPSFAFPVVKDCPFNRCMNGGIYQRNMPYMIRNVIG